ncbi:MAG: hypothetical protein KC910_22930, partial [Candidatus Eremiobacteraeota bacterium]|nr:hypothetical protein [Candidatus Eremiobacteraeota bacterium]
CGPLERANERKLRILVKVAEKGIQAASGAFPMPGSRFGAIGRGAKFFLKKLKDCKISCLAEDGVQRQGKHRLLASRCQDSWQ